jgi:hypothetical protein
MRTQNLITNWYEVQKNLFKNVVPEYILAHLGSVFTALIPCFNVSVKSLLFHRRCAVSVRGAACREAMPLALAEPLEELPLVRGASTKEKRRLYAPIQKRSISTNYLLLLGEDAFNESSLRLKTKLELNTPIRTTKVLVKLGSGTVLVLALALGVERIVKEL